MMFEKRVSLVFLALTLAFGWPLASSAQTFVLENQELPVGATEVTMPWSYAAGANATGIGVFFDFNTARLTVQTEVVGGDTVVAGCIGDAAALLPVAVCAPTLAQPPQFSLGLSGVFNALPNLAPGGAITFQIDPPLAEGDTLQIELLVNEAGVTPGGTVLTVQGGQISAIPTPPAVAAIAPPSWTVASVAGGAAPSQIFTVSNAAETGQTPPAANLAIQSVALEGAPQFTRDGGTCSAGTTSLAPGASCTVIVQLSTAAIGDFTGTLRVGHSAGADLTAALTGAVRDTDAALVIEPTTFDFGELDIDAAASCRAFAISNTPGEDALTVGTATVTGAPFSVTSNTCNGTTLAGGASCSVTVCFDPAEEGAANDSLVVTSDANNVSAALSGTGTATANISVNPDFGPVNLGTGEAGETLTANGTITNSGSAAADVSCVLDDPSGVFSTAPSPLTATVDANSTVPFTLSCALPTAGEQGDAYAATLTCSVDRQEVGDHELSCDITDFVPVPVPTMSSWSIALFALLMLLVGGFSIRMFRIQ